MDFLSKSLLKYNTSPFLYAIILIVTYLSLGIVFAGDHSKVIWIFNSLSFLISFWCFINTSRTLGNFLSLTLPLMLLMSLPCIISSKSFLFSIIINYIVMTPIIVLFGMFAKKKPILVVISAVLIFLNIIYIYPNSIMYFERPKDHNVKYNFPYIKLLDKDSMPRDIERQKIAVVDFYSSYCGICFKKFPEYERLKQKYNSDTNVKFYAIHVGYDKDTFSNSIKLLDEYSYSFNKLYSISRNEIRDSLGFESFPQLFIIKNGQIVHHGFLETNANIILDNTDEIIHKLLRDISNKPTPSKNLQN